MEVKFVTVEKNVSGKLTDEQLKLGLELLEKRAVVERAAPKKRKPRQSGKQSAPKAQQGEPAKQEPQKNDPKQKAGTENTSSAKEKSGKEPAKQEGAKPQQRKRRTTNSSKQTSAGGSKQTSAGGSKQTSKGSTNKGTANKGAAKGTNKRSAPAAEKADTHTTSAKSASNAKSSSKQNSHGRRGRSKDKEASKTPVRIIPLGGLNEVGKNVTVYECQNDMLLIDCGMTFPDEQMLGVDLVLPDLTYVVKNREKLRGIVITHGHEDHIGALPYFLKQVNVPVYATKLTIGLIENKLKEHGLYGKVKLMQIAPGETVKLG